MTVRLPESTSTVAVMPGHEGDALARVEGKISLYGHIDEVMANPVAARVFQPDARDC